MTVKTHDDGLGGLHLSQRDRADLIRTVRDIECARTWRTRSLATRRALDMLYPRTKPQSPVVPIESLAPDEPVAEPVVTEVAPKVIDLMAALKESLERATRQS